MELCDLLVEVVSPAGGLCILLLGSCLPVHHRYVCTESNHLKLHVGAKLVIHKFGMEHDCELSQLGVVLRCILV